MTARLRVRATNGRLVTAHELEMSNALERLAAEFSAFKELMAERDKGYGERDASNKDSVRTAREEQRQQAVSLAEKIALGREEIERQLKLHDSGLRDLGEWRSKHGGEGAATEKGQVTLERLVDATKATHRWIIGLVGVIVTIFIALVALVKSL